MRRLETLIRRRVFEALDDLAANPDQSSMRKLVGYDEYRIRVGDIRVRFRLNEEERIILVERVLHRREAYRDL